MLRTEDVSQTLDDRARGDRIFDGVLLVFRNVPDMHRLCAHADRLIRSAFHPLEPVTAQHALAPAQFLERATAVQTAFETDARCRALFTGALASIGASLAVTYRDRLRLRVFPHGDSHAGGRVSSTGVHRDTWGSNLHAQTNWWAPVYQVNERNTIVFHPRYWSQPLANTSATWRFEALLASRRRGAGSRYPTAPEPLTTPDHREAIPVLIDPGDLLCFSGAHLHGGAPNTSGRTRISIETRTVNLDDLRAGRGAPNIDCGARATMHRWFEHISDGRALTDVLDEQSPTV